MNRPEHWAVPALLIPDRICPLTDQDGFEKSESRHPKARGANYGIEV
jgi:hypothetical protein